MMMRFVPCYTPKQVYKIEKNWFNQKNSNYGLMEQAGWQMAQWLVKHYPKENQQVLIIIGKGNNGGDGLVVASHLATLRPNWEICVVEITEPTTKSALKAKFYYCLWVVLQHNNADLQPVKMFLENQQKNQLSLKIDLIVDAMFGIGLDSKPVDDFKEMIDFINQYKSRYPKTQVISIDVPSGLNATTGEVYQQVAVKADKTLCLVARKVGLHLKDAKDYTGEVVDIPLIPISPWEDLPTETAYYCDKLPQLPSRLQNQHKGNFGHVLIIGGNQLINGQAMIGAGLLAASSAFVAGAGKVTIACPQAFHGAIVNYLPNVMTVNLTSIDTVQQLIEQVDCVAFGMGLGRDSNSFSLFKIYLRKIIDSQKTCVLDADALYHLASLSGKKDVLKQEFLTDIFRANLYFTPHSGEAGRLLKMTAEKIEENGIFAIQALSKKYGGHWVLKGANSIIQEENYLYISGLGNSGMATAGMGDVLAGLIAGLLAQKIPQPLLIATLLHAKAGDKLAKKKGAYALQAKDMIAMLGKVIKKHS